MSLELGQPADGDQATSAEDPAEEQSAPRGASDTPNAYADSGAAPAPSFSAVWGAPDTSGTTESATTADPSNDPEPSTSGPPTIPGTVVDSDTPDTPETASAPEASSAPDDVDDPETSTVAEDSSAPDALDARQASDAAHAPAVAEDPDESGASDPSDAAEPAAPGASGATGPADDADSSVPDADTDTATDAGTPTDADAASTAEEADAYHASGPAQPAADVASVPAQAGPEDMTGRPSAAGTTAAPNAPAASAGGQATLVQESSADGGRPSVAARLEAAAGDLDGPLIGDVEGLRYSWQQIQIGFVDDPRETVVDAAVLVEHAAQSLIDALQQRQRLLRSLWDRSNSLDGLGSPPASSPAEPQAAGRGEPSGDIPDTEDLRLLIQRYRSMFNEICKP